MVPDFVTISMKYSKLHEEINLQKLWNVLRIDICHCTYLAKCCLNNSIFRTPLLPPPPHSNPYPTHTTFLSRGVDFCC